MELSGTIHAIFEAKDISANFRKREMVILTEEQYPQHVLVEFTQDRVNLLDGYKKGEKVKVSINIRGREWNSPQGETRYFVTIQGWRIERMESADRSNIPVPSAPDFSTDEPDDLPF